MERETSTNNLSEFYLHIFVICVSLTILTTKEYATWDYMVFIFVSVARATYLLLEAFHEPQ